jgi:hypothetical protein
MFLGMKRFFGLSTLRFVTACVALGPEQGDTPLPRHLYRSRGEEQARLARRAHRPDRYAQMVTLHQQGLRAAGIAHRIGIGERTVRRWLAHGTFPEAKRRRRRPSLIDPYEAYVKKRWREGCHNVAVKRDFAKSLLTAKLHRELTARG